MAYGGTIERVDAELEDELEGTPELSELKARIKRENDRRYPEPTIADIQTLRDNLRETHTQWHQDIEDRRSVRFQRDELPEKYRRRKQGPRRFRSRLSHNEINRVVAMQTRNPLKVEVPRAGGGDLAGKQAQKQTRWAQQLMPALERKQGKPLRRPFVDNQDGDGSAFYEVYLTDAYEKLDLDRRTEVDEDGVEVEESSTNYLKRTEADLMRAGLPFGVRRIDPVAVLRERDDEGICYALIEERKPYRQVYAALVKSVGSEKLDELSLPTPGTPGWAEMLGDVEKPSGTVKTIRYYDRRWYAFIVGDRFVDGPREHGMPSTPVFESFGMLTSSPNMSEAYQGVTWGMTEMECSIDDLMDTLLDEHMRFSRPKPVIITPDVGQLMRGKDDKPTVLDLSIEGVQQLNPGQQIVDAFGGFQPKIPDYIISTLRGFRQHSGLNPIAQGESPGSDPAGYTVNALTNAAQANYEVLLDNEARTWGQVVDFVRLLIRDTIKERVYLSVPMADRKEGGTEWLALGPDDVDETPSLVSIDPLSDTNRLALRQSLMEGLRAGLIGRPRVQREGYGVEDTDVEDDQIIQDKAFEMLANRLIEEVMQIIAAGGLGIAPQPGMAPADPNAIQQNGGAPAPTQAPTVGVTASDASTAFGSGGPSALPASRGNAGGGGRPLPSEGA